MKGDPGIPLWMGRGRVRAVHRPQRLEATGERWGLDTCVRSPMRGQAAWSQGRGTLSAFCPGSRSWLGIQGSSAWALTVEEPAGHPSEMSRHHLGSGLERGTGRRSWVADTHKVVLSGGKRSAAPRPPRPATALVWRRSQDRGRQGRLGVSPRAFPTPLPPSPARRPGMA